MESFVSCGVGLVEEAAHPKAEKHVPMSFIA